MKDDLLLNRGPQVNPLDYPSIKCKKCGSILFGSAVVLKEIPGTLIGAAGETVQYPLKVFICKKCGEILDSDIKMYKLEKDLEDNTENKSSIHVENNNGSIIIS